MKDGLYVAQFVVGADHGHGVAVKRGERIVGGDSSHWYEGRMAEVDGGEIEGELTVRPHTGGNPSVFGFFDQFPLTLRGRQAGTAWQFIGSTPVAPGRAMQLNLRLLRADDETRA
jgi:hypothetical protein